MTTASRKRRPAGGAPKASATATPGRPVRGEVLRLEEEVARLASFPLRSPYPITEVDLEGTVRFANPAAERLFPDLAQRGPDHPWLHGWAGVVAACRGDAVDLPAREITVEGRWYQQTMYHVSDLGRVRIYGLDVTERQQSEEEHRRLAAELRERMGELKALQDCAPVAIWIAHDPLCRKITGNAYADELVMNVPRGANISRSAPPDQADLEYRTWRDGVELGPDELPAQRAAATGEPVTDAEVELSFADGRRVHLLMGAVPLRDASGRVRGAVATGVDITRRKHAEEALQRKEATERGILDATQESIWLFDRDGTILASNETGLRRMGRSAEECIGKHPTEILPAELARTRLERIREVVETNRPVESEDERAGFRFHHSFFPVRDDQGAVLQVACFSRDITESRRAEEALRLSETRARLLSETAGKLLASEDPQQLVSELCRGVMENLDCQAFFNFLVCEPAGRLRLNAWAGIPEAAARAIEWLDVGVAVCGCVARDRARILVEDVQHSLDPRADLVRSHGIQAYCCHPLLAQGRVIGTLSFGTRTRTSFTADEVAVMRTVADQVATAMQRVSDVAALKDSKERLARSQKIAHLGSWELDLESHVLTWSDEVYRIFGLAPQAVEVSYEAFLERIHPDDREAVHAAYEGSLNDALDCYAIDHRVVRMDTREVRWVQEKCTHVRNAAGRIIRSIGMVHDITENRRAVAERERLVQKLEAKNRELSEFAHVISHDLKAPLRAVNSLAGMLATDLGERLDPEDLDRLTLLMGRVKRMHLLIEGVLEYSRVGREEREPSRVDLNGVVDQAVDLISPPGHLSVSVARPLPVVFCDRTGVAQVFQNLIGNAIKHHDKPRGRIRVGCTQVDGEHRIYVADDGPGIDPTHFERIFKIFQTLRRRDETESTGIGLAIVKRIVEAWGGRVWLESRLGEGSTFWFSVPLGEDELAG